MVEVKKLGRSKARKKSLEINKSVVIYRYLKSNKDDGAPDAGFKKMSIGEIFNGVNEDLKLLYGRKSEVKILRKNEIATALRRGIDWGIVEKVEKKYRYDPNSNAVLIWKEECLNKDKKKSNKTSPTQKRQPVPRPRVPRPPSFKPPKRNLREEPMPRLRKRDSRHLERDPDNNHSLDPPTV